MRIIAGTLKGASLISIRGDDVRPTLDRVRESVFNILTPYLDDGSVFLDLFAGTGANGLEALSRGALRSIFIDSAPKSLKMVRENAEKLGVAGDCTVLRGDVVEVIGSNSGRFGPVSIVYADPPFDYEGYGGLLEVLDDSDVLAPDGLVLIEHSVRRELPKEQGGLCCYRTQQYGKTQVSFYRGTSSISEES